ncbi:MFS transporter [Streptomyces sp. NBC_01244]|uniref:MFS transporter n=1 Tax=Streptomyces sp. NBC_01244 TaxID=2903797 RepID=UPI002E144915|nr:MFS transporter [Streptomyces sp. NBC_01244]
MAFSSTPALPALLVRERARPAWVRSRAGAWRLAVGTVCFGAFMGQLDASIVTMTYPGVRAEFGVPLAGVEWVSLAYLLTLVALLVPVGRLSDAHGRKLSYLYGFALFTGASAACGLAPTLIALIGFRVVQAVGAAMLQANSVALVKTSTPAARLRTALGVQAAAQAVGLALGPTVGAALVAGLGWRWTYWINVPVGLIALAAGHYLLPRTRDRAPVRRFDRAGVLWLATATAALLVALSSLSGLHVPAWTGPAACAVALGATAALVRRERRAPAPLLDPALLKAPAIRGGLAAALCGYLVLFGPLVLVPVLLLGSGYGVLVAGAVLTALPAGFALGAVGGDRALPAAVTDRARCLYGSLLTGCALAALLFLAPAPAPLACALGVLGLGLGLFAPANNALVMRAVPTEAPGTGGGLINMARGLGTAIGVALVTLALHTGGDGGRLAVLILLAAAAVMAVTGSGTGARAAPAAAERE